MKLENHRLSIKNIKDSVELIDDIFLNTPQYINPGLSKMFGLNLTVKIETINPIRCFKGRGAEVLISKSKGYKHLVCASAGN